MTSQAWALLNLSSVRHVVPVWENEPDKPANGHELSPLCWCHPRRISAPLDDCILSHNDAQWPGAVDSSHRPH